MTNPRELAEYFGFTEYEVKALCDEHCMSFEEAKAWYDGYELVTQSRNGAVCHLIYSPKSVVDAMLSHNYNTYSRRNTIPSSENFRPAKASRIYA